MSAIFHFTIPKAAFNSDRIMITLPEALKPSLTFYCSDCQLVTSFDKEFYALLCKDDLYFFVGCKKYIFLKNID